MCIRITLPSALALAVLLLSACTKDPQVPASGGSPAPQAVLALAVKPTWNGAAFNRDSVYVSAAGQRIRAGELKFYLAPLRLEGPQGDHEVFDADLFNMTDGPQYRTIAVPAGNYQRVHLGLGLPYALNHRDLATVPPNAPTGNNSGMYWNWATQYRFVIFSGRWDGDPHGTGDLPNVFDLHTGLDTLYRTRSIPFSLHASAEDTVRLTIIVDIARFFTDGTRQLDLSQHSMWHGTGDLDFAIMVADLQAAALSIEP